MQFVYHNPPGRKGKARKTRKARTARKVSAKQRANWARFARMAKARAKATHRRKSHRKAAKKHRSRRVHTNPPRGIVSFIAPRRAKRMARRSKSTRRRGSRRRAGSSARAFALNPMKFISKEMLLDAGALVGGMIIVPKIVEKLALEANGQPKAWIKGADGQVSQLKYLAVKAALGLAAAAIVGKVAKQPRLARGIALSTISMIGYDLINKQIQKAGTTSAGVAGYDDSGMPLLAGDGMGNQFLDVSQYAAVG